MGNEGSHVALGLVDLDPLDHCADQPPAVLRAEGVPDQVEIGKAARDTFGIQLATVEKRTAMLHLPKPRFESSQLLPDLPQFDVEEPLASALDVAHRLDHPLSFA